MHFNVRVKILGHTFNVRNVEAENEFSAELKVRRIIERNITFEHVHPSKSSNSAEIENFMKIFGMKP